MDQQKIGRFIKELRMEVSFSLFSKNTRSISIFRVFPKRLGRVKRETKGF